MTVNLTALNGVSEDANSYVSNELSQVSVDDASSANIFKLKGLNVLEGNVSTFQTLGHQAFNKLATDNDVTELPVSLNTDTSNPYLIDPNQSVSSKSSTSANFESNAFQTSSGFLSAKGFKFLGDAEKPLSDLTSEGTPLKLPHIQKFCSCPCCQASLTSPQQSISTFSDPVSGTTSGLVRDNRIDSLLSGYRLGAAGTTNVTYSFVNSSTATNYIGGGESVSPVTEAIKASVRTILTNLYAPLIGLTFTEVTESDNTFGQIRYMASNLGSTNSNGRGYAYAYYPDSDSSDSVSSDVHLSTDYIYRAGDTNSFSGSAGSHGFSTLIHETGHALGLKHPGNYNAGGGGTEGPYLPYDQDNFTNTVMGYNFTSGEPSTLMKYDVLALRSIYGTKNLNATNTTYNFSSITAYTTDGESPTSSGSDANQLINLVDDGGADTLNFSALPSNSSGYRFDINAGGFLTRQSDYNGSSYTARNDTSGTRYFVPSAGVILNTTSTIENLINSSSDDYIIANSTANTFSGYSPTKTTGKDTIEGSNNSDTLDLSAFAASAVSNTQTGNNLILGLGSSGQVTIKDFYSAPASNRINVKYSAVPTTLAIAATDANKNEGSSGITPFTFTVTRSGDLSSTTTVNYSVSGSGTNPADAADFGSALPSGIVSFGANETSKLITINVNGDIGLESNEGFALNLANASNSATISTATAVGSILNDDTNIVTTGTSPYIFNGGNVGSTLTGTSNRDRITGGSGNDILIGGLGGDYLNGGLGADIYTYNGLTDSLVTATDRIISFNQSEGDRFRILTGNPTNLTELGAVTGVDLTAAATSAFANLSMGSAGFFGWNYRRYLGINDSKAGFNTNTDLVVEVTGLSSNSPLLVSNYFI